MTTLSPDFSPAIRLETGPNPQYSIIWMHGLGADGNDFVPIVEALNLTPDMKVRFIFPHAPTRPVSINNGLVMRAWYDIKDPKLDRFEDEAGIYASQKIINTLIEEEIQQGVVSKNIVLAGFSQGGVMALQAGLHYTSKLAGIMALSCYLPLVKKFKAEVCTINASTLIFMAHGTHDPIIPITQANTSRELLLAANFPLEWHEYAMAHAVCTDEISDISNWLQQLFQQ